MKMNISQNKKKPEFFEAFNKIPHDMYYVNTNSVYDCYQHNFATKTLLLFELFKNDLNIPDGFSYEEILNTVKDLIQNGVDQQSLDLAESLMLTCFEGVKLSMTIKEFEAKSDELALLTIPINTTSAYVTTSPMWAAPTTSTIKY